MNIQSDKQLEWHTDGEDAVGKILSPLKSMGGLAPNMREPAFTGTVLAFPGISKSFATHIVG